MGDVIRLHARASAGTRAANSAKSSAVRPADCAVEVRKIGSHHSAGILSRCGHLRAAAMPAPISSANASGVGHKATTSRKVSIMPEILGQTVPKVKAMVSHDIGRPIRHTVLMTDDDENSANSQWDREFRDRIIRIQGGRTQEDMAELLCITRDAYSKYVGSRMSKMPIRLLPRLAKIGAMTLEELILGPKAKPAVKQKPARKRKTG